MSYIVELAPLKITTPSLESLDHETRNRLLAWRLGFRARGAKAMEHYRSMIRIEMQPINKESELVIWKTFATYQFDDNFFGYCLNPIPLEVLQHYEEARKTNAFAEFAIWGIKVNARKEEPELSLLIGYDKYRHNGDRDDRRYEGNIYILAKWQPKREELITLDAIKQSIQKGHQSRGREISRIPTIS